MTTWIFAALYMLSATVQIEGTQKCSGKPRMFNGKHCASTTKYADYHKGACGCGPENNDNQFDWNHSGLVAAANQELYDNTLSKWCGKNCGKCVKLTTTGGFVDGQGSAIGAGQSHVFMITNNCPDEAPNLSWCSQSAQTHHVNQYGYGAHFDLENGAGQLAAIGWADKNPEVTWEFTDCNAAHAHEAKTPSSSMYHQCYCATHPGGGKK